LIADKLPVGNYRPTVALTQTTALPDSRVRSAPFYYPVKLTQHSNRSKTMIFYIIGVVVVIAVVASYLGLHF
jgi:hypothetical protein